MRRGDAFGVLDHGIDQAVVKVGKKIRFPVIPAPERLTSIEHGLMRSKRLSRDGIGDRRAEGLERAHRTLSRGRIACPAGGDRCNGGAVYRLWQEGGSWRSAKDQQAAQFVGSLSSDLAKMACNVARSCHPMDDHAA